MTNEEFLNKIKPDVIADMHESNILASLTAAQALLESGHGESKLAAYPNNNLFGIKGSYNGNYVIMKTKEYVNGKYIVVDAAFKKYRIGSHRLKITPRCLTDSQDTVTSEANATIRRHAETYIKMAMQIVPSTLTPS